MHSPTVPSCQHPFATSQQIDFYQVDARIEQFVLLSEVLSTTSFGRFVGETQEFDGRDDSTTGFGVENLDVSQGLWFGMGRNDCGLVLYDPGDEIAGKLMLNCIAGVGCHRRIEIAARSFQPWVHSRQWVGCEFHGSDDYLQTLHTSAPTHYGRSLGEQQGDCPAARSLVCAHRFLYLYVLAARERFAAQL